MEIESRKIVSMRRGQGVELAIFRYSFSVARWKSSRDLLHKNVNILNTM